MSLIIYDPIRYDYTKVVDQILDWNIKELNVLIYKKFENVNSLDVVLNVLYDEFRTLALSKGYSYKFEINIIFDMEYQEFSDTYEDVYCIEGDIPEVGVEVIEMVGVKQLKGDISSRNLHIDFANNITKQGTTACGGTFDHLHDGHKILLSITTYLATSKIIVGVTDSELLKNKKYKEQLDSFETRVLNTVTFIKKLLSSNEHKNFEIFKIIDVCGPTGYIQDIDILVLSQETSGGGEFVNNYRKDIGFKQLDIFTIKLIGGENKLSSTDLRRLSSSEAKPYN